MPGDIFFWNDGVAYQIREDQRAIIEGIQAIWDALTADSDGDGTIDVLDNFRGFNDSTVVVVSSTSSQTMAKIADNIYAVFNSSGDKISPYMAMTGASTSSGNAEVGFQISVDGVGFTFKGDNQIGLQYEAIPNPVGLP